MSDSETSKEKRYWMKNETRLENLSLGAAASRVTSISSALKAKALRESVIPTERFTALHGVVRTNAGGRLELRYDVQVIPKSVSLVIRCSSTREPTH
jgi:hypothetical protein